MLLALASLLISYADIHERLRPLLNELGIDEARFASWLDARRSETERRLKEGAWDEAVYYLLQSRRITKDPPLEPAAIASVQGVPKAASKRIAAFAAALRNPGSDGRLKYFASWLKPEDAGSKLPAEYMRVMKFLHAKEVESRSAGPDQRFFIAGLYQSRGFSTDSHGRNFTVIEKALERLPPGKIQRVLLVGPGQDFAPRTGLDDRKPPESHQPRRLYERLNARIDAVDIHPRVIDHIDAWRHPAIRALRRDIRFERLEDKYDLVIATNVFLYFDAAELLLAFNNIASVLKPGGRLIHNDTRFECSLFGRSIGLDPVTVDQVNLDDRRRPPLADSFVVHQLKVD